MITLAGLSHRTAPIEVRERLSVPEERIQPLLQAARDHFERGAALLSTCNRLELYVSGNHSGPAMHTFLAQHLDADADTLARQMPVRTGADAIGHLYAVACGIDSMVLGETEVLGQVRAAFSGSVKAQTDDVLVARLFHTALRAGRRARTETGISARALSVSSIAAQQAKAQFDDLSAATVLVIGAGEAGRLAAQAVLAQGARDVVVVNRTQSRAEGLAVELGGRAEPMSALPRVLASAHIAIAAAGSPEPLVPLSMLSDVMQRRDGEPLLVIDIGVPRDFEAGAHTLPGVSYFDLDDLRSVADRNAEARQSEVDAVATIVSEEVEKFVRWAEALQVQPTIAAIAGRAEAMRQVELAKALRRLPRDARSEEERTRFEELADAMSRALVKQILADPIRVLRERGDLNFTVEAARAMFRLDPPAN